MDSDLARTLIKELYGWRRVVILGLGNELGGDDQSGLLVARELKRVLPSNVTGIDIFETGIAPENYTGVLRNLLPSHVIIVDAAEIGKEAGWTAIINTEHIQELIPSTHSLPLSMLANYIEQEFHAKVIILGIQPKELSFSTKVSAEVKNTVKKLATLLSESLLDREPCHREAK